MIAIKGMAMPKNCCYCRFKYDQLCHAVGQSFRERRLEENGRLKDCPLIEVADNESLHIKSAKTAEQCNGMTDLKQQEPLNIARDHVDEFYGYVAHCPECNCLWMMYQDADMKYCPGCRRAVTWDG